ncbi:hypothetical protein NUU61_000694, partial [Penicillium alfredii]
MPPKSMPISSQGLYVIPEKLVLDVFHCWEQNPDSVLIRERSAIGPDREWTVAEFLYDVLIILGRLRDAVCVQRLERTARGASVHEKDDDDYVAVLAGGGYGFAVLTLAIYAIGAVAVPLSPRVLPEEAQYFLSTCNAVLLATTPENAEQAQAISRASSVPVFTFRPSRSRERAQSEEGIDTDAFQPQFYSRHDATSTIPGDNGFVLLYTSGTTGPPKGVLHTRDSAHKLHPPTRASHSKEVSQTMSETWLHHQPVHWGGGFMSMMKCLLMGTCLEFCGGVFSPAWLLDRLQDPRRPPVTGLFLSPPLLDAVASDLEGLRLNAPDRYEGALEGIRGLRALSSGAMQVNPRQREVWASLRGGKPLMVLYGLTENFGIVAMTGWRGSEESLESCGPCMPEVTVKIADDGEICIKTPVLFKKYLSPNPNIMDNVFDSDGFYRTGDIGRLEDDRLFVLGRASQDVIRSHGWKIYALEVENALSQMDSVVQAIVLGVPDSHAGQRVAALLVYRVRDKGRASEFDFSQLRETLAIQHGLQAYKLPTMLRILEPSDKVAVTVSGKPMKTRIRDMFFNEKAVACGEVQVWDSKSEEGVVGTRPFDWAGIQ